MVSQNCDRVNFVMLLMLKTSRGHNFLINQLCVYIYILYCIVWICYEKTVGMSVFALFLSVAAGLELCPIVNGLLSPPRFPHFPTFLTLPSSPSPLLFPLYSTLTSLSLSPSNPIKLASNGYGVQLLSGHFSHSDLPPLHRLPRRLPFDTRGPIPLEASRYTGQREGSSSAPSRHSSWRPSPAASFPFFQLRLPNRL